MTQKQILTVVVLVIGLGIGAVYGFSLTRGTDTSAQRTAQEPASDVFQQPNQLDLNHVPQTGREAARDRIRAFTRHNQLNASYKFDATNPYYGTEKLDVLWDDQGMEYWIHPASHEVVQMMVRPGADQDHPQMSLVMSPKRPQTELESIAARYVEERVPGVSQLQTSFTPRHTDKSVGDETVYFFRWEDKAYFGGYGEKAAPPYYGKKDCMCSGGPKLLDPGDIWMLAIEVTRHRVH